ncbi:unnamed protein product [Allacma fusca]|uniref:Uncharacterized protein n=1 Tax=Allacma fusca TaxID=39272 RepID=A0A8J2L359_9HEXA|nr:unnamed protein product [Allacma fusca]
MGPEAVDMETNLTTTRIVILITRNHLLIDKQLTRNQKFGSRYKMLNSPALSISSTSEVDRFLYYQNFLNFRIYKNSGLTS